MRDRPRLRVLRDVIVLLVLALLPPAVAGCARALGQHLQMRPSEVASADPATAARHAPTRSPRPGEELWVIRRPGPPAATSAEGGGVPRGAWLAARSGDGALVAIPLARSDVRASIAGPVTAVDVTQQFHNPSAPTVQVVYAFPLPTDAAGNEFV